MRVNVYAEEMTDRIEIIGKEIDGHRFTGLRFYLELPVTKTIDGKVRQLSGPFTHRPGDDDSAAVTFWGKQDLRVVLRIALERLDEHYSSRGHEPPCERCGGSGRLTIHDTDPRSCGMPIGDEPCPECINARQP